jgi:hypothetical protein
MLVTTPLPVLQNLTIQLKLFVLLSWIFIVESDIDHGDDARLGQESHASSEYDNRNGESASL